MAALEAMACGVPVVSTDSGGTPEVNTHGVSGLLSAVGDIDHMAANALEILKNEETRQRYRAGALREAARFRVEAVQPLYEALYSEVLAATPVM